MAALSGVKTLDMVGGKITKVEYGGATYEGVEGEAQAGDIAVIVKPWSYIKQGEFYAVEKTSKGRGNTYVDLGGIVVGYREHVEVFRKQSAKPSPTLESLDARVSALEGVKDETITHEGVQYSRVHRKAQAGDVVVFTEGTGELVGNNKPYEVKRDCQISSWGGRVPVYKQATNRTESNVKVYAPAETKPAPLKVGDYVVVVGGKNHMERLSKGDIAEITSKEYAYDFRVKRLSDGEKELFDTEEIRKATDEEVAAAKAKQAEDLERKELERKWAAIGRKPNEYKAGDIVIVTAPSSGHDVGTIGEVVRTEEAKRPHVRARYSNGEVIDLYSIVEIVTPVEARFDKN